MIASILRICIKAYRLLISPFLYNNCRYTPTCSEYALDALRIHGVLKGGFLAIKRIMRCHPWSKSGFDPVPDGNRHECCKHN